MNFDNLQFRCSQLSKLVVEPKGKKIYLLDGHEIDAKRYNKFMDNAVLSSNFELLKALSTKTEKVDESELSETTKTHLIDVYVQNKHSRKNEIHNKYLKKGNECEEDSITLYSRVAKTLFSKNEKMIENEFIKGTLDAFTGVSIEQAEMVLDIKTSWDAYTYFRTFGGKLNPDYEWQVKGYMALTGAKKAKVAFCLVNSTQEALDEEKKKLAYKYNCFTSDETPAYKAACSQLEINMIYDLESFRKHYGWYEFHTDIKDWHYDIPMEERVHEFEVVHSDADIELLYSKIAKARVFLNDFYKRVSKQ